ncbi:MAG: GTP-binding protein [Candidatus Helarchaeota archaeon]|nr:GTP-binding protein [Candidatus Helarchaeota archaeon]
MSLKLSFKLCIVGERAVGKTSLIIRYIENKFQENYIPTLGVDFLTKKIVVGKESKIPVNLIIWDIGGDDIWKDRLHLYLRGADGVLIIYDITRPQTFNQIDFWINKIAINAGEIPYMVIGNKNDLKDLRKVTTDQAISKLKKRGNIELLETSAKTGKTVNEMFQKIAEKIIIQKAKSKK